MMNRVCSRCGADWKSDDGCSAACESVPVMAARINTLEQEKDKDTARLLSLSDMLRESEAKVSAATHTIQLAKELLDKGNSRIGALEAELAVERKRREDAEALLTINGAASV